MTLASSGAPKVADSAVPGCQGRRSAPTRWEGPAGRRTRVLGRQIAPVGSFGPFSCDPPWCSPEGKIMP